MVDVEAAVKAAQEGLELAPVAAGGGVVSALRAFIVFCRACKEYDPHFWPCEAAFAESQQDARRIVKRLDCDCGWTALAARRAKDADVYAESHGRGRVRKSEILRVAGMSEEGAPQCYSCGLAEWRDVPGSEIDDDGECGECCTNENCEVHSHAD